MTDNTNAKMLAMQKEHGPLLEVKDLAIDFTTDTGKPVHAVRDANFTVYPGQWVAIVGESGSGKSTSAMAVLGLLPGTGHVVNGSIKLDGEEIAGAKQSGNPWLPEVRALTGGVDELVELSRVADQRILPWEMQENVPMLTPDLACRTGVTVYIIGPEGGFSARELDALRAAGFAAVSLGARILRCETAATLCLGIHWWASQLPGRNAEHAES